MRVTRYPGTEGKKGRRAWRIALGLLIALLFSGVVSAAYAQIPDPVGQDVVQDPFGEPPPVPPGYWEQIAGARFGSTRVIGESTTPFDLDLYTVSFLDPKHGLVGGAECKLEPAPPAPGESAEDYAARVRRCEDENGNPGPRAPVIYGLVDDQFRGLFWERMELGPGSERPGFVGKIAWIGADRALAVGGTGTYPRREPGFDADDPDGARSDPAGMGRAWLYENGAWRELANLPDGTEGDEVPDAMRGMIALDASSDPEDCGEGVSECAVAGALGQLWHFQDARFDFEPRLTATRDDGTAQPIRLRVRAVRFLNRKAPDRVAAVTSGCCLRASGDDGAAPTTAPAPALALALPSFTGGEWEIAEEVPPAGEQPPRDPSLWPDSLYDLFYSDPYLDEYGGDWRWVALLNPGGPEKAKEPATIHEMHTASGRAGGFISRWSCKTTRDHLEPGFAFARRNGIERDPTDSHPLNGFFTMGDPFQQPLGAGGHTCSARIVAADIDVVGEKNVFVGQLPDGFPDWGVGLLRSTGQGLFHTVYALAHPCADDPDESCRTSGPMLAPSYALNDIEAIDAVGRGWAVGDHGAILRLGGGDAFGVSQDLPARLGSRAPARLPDPAPYEPFARDLTSEPGLVPPLAARPETELAEPRFVTAETPNGTRGGSVRSIVISRDGSEGWAFGGSSGFIHFDGTRWRDCAAESGQDRLAPDRACASALALAPSGIKAVTRVPLENDDDPTNDDEFEVIAVGAGPLRYRGGRWERDPQGLAAAAVDIAFTAPDDGWAVGPARATGSAPNIYHFDGEAWISGCTFRRTLCDDEDGRLESVHLERLGWRGLRLAVAGERTYLFGTREGVFNAGQVVGSEPYPMIIYHDRGGKWSGGMDTTEDGEYNPTDGGWDPGCTQTTLLGCVATGDPEDQGGVFSLAVSEDANGELSGWAPGRYAARLPRAGGEAKRDLGMDDDPKAVMLRLEEGRWRMWSAEDAGDDYLRAPTIEDGQLLALPDEAGRRTAFAFPTGYVSTGTGFAPALAFDRVRRRWEVLSTPWSSQDLPGLEPAAGLSVYVAAPDAQGGLWAAVKQYGACGGCGGNLSFHHYTDRAPEPVFTDEVNPARDQAITAFAAGADGSLWLGDEQGSVYRYDRMTGWQGVSIPGWDGPRAVRRSPVTDVSVGPDGGGIAVGPAGRIADLAPGEVRLDPAAGKLCDASNPVPPCGAGGDLTAVAVAPDGSALVSGSTKDLLWRPAGGEFRRIAPPPVGRGMVRDIVMPRADRAYILLAHTGTVIAGDLEQGAWRWRVELPAPGVRAIAVDSSDHGYAVGTGGLLLERGGDGAEPWRRLGSGYLDDFEAVALPVGGEGEGALVGGSNGLLLTLIGERLEVARPADPYDPTISGFMGYGAVTGLAVIPGGEPGQVEAWAALRAPDGGFNWRTPAPQALLHYASHRQLGVDRGLEPIADAPPARPGEISFAAFGKQDCRTPRNPLLDQTGVSGEAFPPCNIMDGSNLAHEVIAKRIDDELLARARRPGGPAFALFTGDASDAVGGGSPTAAAFAGLLGEAGTPLDRDAKHRRWVELVANPLADDGLPVFGAIGGQDLVLDPRACPPSPLVGFFVGGCLSTKQAQLNAGANLPWRTTMGGMPAPWERDGDGAAGAVDAERAEPGLPAVAVPDAATPEVTVNLPLFSWVRVGSVSSGRGATHYAFDLLDQSQAGRKVARLVVIDTSLGSLAAGDPVQQPLEAGGQLRWLDEMLCFDGSLEDTSTPARNCTREAGQQAIVLSNAPTYSYGPISPDELQKDAAAFEAILLKNQVNVVVSGRLGWNGRYWALAPGVHAPCPGQGYRPDSDPPSLTDAEICGAGAGEDADASQLTSQLPPAAQEVAGLASRTALPFVVSSSGGGRFNIRAERSGFATAEGGFWRGYSIVRLDPSGDPRKTIVEQRPLLDWVGLTADERVLAPRATLRLESVAREPFGVDTVPRYYEIPETQAITHRYDLLLADPDAPWLPCEAADAACQALQTKLAGGSRSLDSEIGSADLSARDDIGRCEPYLCLPERVGTLDATTGELRAGNGKYPDTFAIAMLSVGDHVATYPLVFRRSPSFVVNPAVARPTGPEVGTDAGFSPDTPPPPNVPKPNVPQPNVPEPPAIPGVPPLTAAQPPEPQPPAPPAPPPPAEQPSPLDLTVSPTALTVATPAAVIQPPTPPVNPAPPSGARREARQRQAATQKSGADSEQEGSEAQHLGGDSASGPPIIQGSAMTRHDPAPGHQHHSFTRHVSAETARGSNNGPMGHVFRPGYEFGRRTPSFTALPRSQPSASAQGLLYGGGVTLLAAVLALGFTTLRPGPRRRTPELPAPVLARIARRR